MNEKLCKKLRKVMQSQVIQLEYNDDNYQALSRPTRYGTHAIQIVLKEGHKRREYKHLKKQVDKNPLVKAVLSNTIFT
jgi:hypothetical protein